MSTKLLLVGVVIMSSVTAAYGYGFEAGNTASYFVGGPPATSSNSAGIGSFHNGGYVDQHAATFVPRGFGYVGQGTWMAGSQISNYGAQEQSFHTGMGQTAYKEGGAGYACGTQVGVANLNQTSPKGAATQGAHATAMQMSMVYGGIGDTGTASQTVHVSTGQVQIH